ncbi:helix-turn-helix domain-containing protein [Micromonospora sp. NPDC048170]|uniref:ATP-binding protein n=1 Tax=Micromonospora sp. NPDC048170 TaxID=3154819 RepID=UPI00340F1A78
MTPDRDRSRHPGGPTGLPELLRGHRLAAGLTQVELAGRAGVGVRTVRDLERGRAARPQRTTVELLTGALELAGAARSAFLAAARGPVPAAGPVTPEGAPPARVDSDPHAGTPTALPPPVALIGRDRDLAELAGSFTDGHGPRLVNLVGLAGVGKTALALSVAHAIAGDHPGGAAGVLVAEGSDAAGLLSASVAAFGVARLPELTARLDGRPALLLVDAAERAPDAVAETVRRLAGAVPSLRVLVTGRHPVGLPRERVWPVAPLDVPPPGGEREGSAALADYPAVALFTTRLARVRREPPGPAELPALVALVRRLGGLPLAIELMAARGRILDLNELLDRYGDRVLDLDTSSGVVERPGWDMPESGREGPRAAVAETLRDAVAISYRLLAPDEQAALRRLAAFGNRWSVELAEEMLADPADRDGTVVVDPVPLLDRLVELGLLSVRGTGPFRFRLLDAVRDFAAEQATAAGELTEIRRRHAQVVARLVARTAPELVGADLPAAVHRLDEVTGDISSALAHAAVDDPSTALWLAAALSRWWRFRGRDVPGRQWLRRLLADPRTADAEPVLRAWAFLGVARLAAEHGAGAEELPAARWALAAFREAGDVIGESEARTVLCALLVALGEHDEARGQAEAVLALAVRHRRVRDMAVAQNNLAWHDVRVGDLAGARRRLAAVDRLAAQCGDQRLRMIARANLAEVSRIEGRYADAVEQGRRVVAALADLGDPSHRRRVLGTVGLALARDGRSVEAAEVLAELRLPPGPPVPRPGEAWSPGRFQGATTPGVRLEDGICALIEGHLALHRGDRELATEWFAAAAEAGVDGQGRRDVVEALVGLAASSGDPAVLDRLDRACRQGGVRLLPHEEELLYASTASRGEQAGRTAGGGGAP